MTAVSAYVGLDVHEDTIAVAAALPGRGEPLDRGEVKNQRKSPRTPDLARHAVFVSSGSVQSSSLVPTPRSA